jgi:nucleoid-associated protein YgaU
MSKDWKVGIAIGAFIIALIALFAWKLSSDESDQIKEKGRDIVRTEGSNDAMRNGLEPTEFPVVGDDTRGGAVGAGNRDSGSVPFNNGSSTVSTNDNGRGTSTGDPITTPVRNPPTNTGLPGTATTTPAVRYHIVKSGEVLSTIANKYYGDRNKYLVIADANKDTLPDINKLKVGMKLRIPYIAATTTRAGTGTNTTTTVTTTTSKRTHTVKKGDSLYVLARKYYGDSTKWRRILNANRDVVRNEKSLAIGTVLTIPPAE